MQKGGLRVSSLWDSRSPKTTRHPISLVGELDETQYVLLCHLVCVLRYTSGELGGQAALASLVA